MTYTSQMITRDQLSKLLLGVNVKDVAALAKVSTKTVYRLRHAQNSPNLDTLNRIVEAAGKLKSIHG